MDVRVEAGVLELAATAVILPVTVELSSGISIIAPVVTRFSLAPVLSVGGNSISAINPEIFKRENMAVA